jgi:hypothetical protein
MGTKITITPIQTSLNVSSVNTVVNVTESIAPVVTLLGPVLTLNVTVKNTTLSLVDQPKVTLNVLRGVNTVITTSTLAISSAGPPGKAGSTYTTGVLTLDFGLGATTAFAVVTGIESVTDTSFITSDLRIEETPDHSTGELLYDPIRLTTHSPIEGVGFTVTGFMDNGTAHGTYKINWIVY